MSMSSVCRTVHGILFLFTSIKAKDKDISRMKRELKDRKQLNHKLRELLSDNQRVAEETGQDLERLDQALTLWGD